MKSFIIFITALMLATSVYAEGNVAAQLTRESAARLPYEHTADYFSIPGESKHQFLLRVAPAFLEYGRQTGFEECAVVAQSPDGTKFGLVVGSTHSHIACINDPLRVPEGMVWTGETIHVHGDGKTHELNKSDDLLIAISNPGVRPFGKRGENINRFSMDDFEVPGYLVTPQGLLFQHGPGTVMTIHSDQ